MAIAAPELVTERDDDPVLASWVLKLIAHPVLILVSAALSAAVGLGISYLVPPTFVSSTSFLSPQQNAGAGALAALGPLAGLATSGQTRNTADQYVALMMSSTISDRVIDRFKLIEVYDVHLRDDARNRLRENVRIAAGKKDGMVVVEVEDRDPTRAAAMANQYIEELREITSRIAVTEAQQRRVYFEQQIAITNKKLVEAQLALQSTGFNQATLQAEPKAAADSYARLYAETTAAEVRLQTLRSALTDSAPEVQSQQMKVSALRAKVAILEKSTNEPNDAGYIARYREFKYQETLFELLARQYESARIDEGREGALIQVVDIAKPSERKFKPSRVIFSITGLIVGLVFSVIWILARRKSH